MRELRDKNSSFYEAQPGQRAAKIKNEDIRVYTALAEELNAEIDRVSDSVTKPPGLDIATRTESGLQYMMEHLYGNMADAQPGRTVHSGYAYDVIADRLSGGHSELKPHEVALAATTSKYGVAKATAIKLGLVKGPLGQGIKLMQSGFRGLRDKRSYLRPVESQIQPESLALPAGHPPMLPQPTPTQAPPQIPVMPPTTQAPPVQTPLTQAPPIPPQITTPPQLTEPTNLRELSHGELKTAAKAGDESAKAELIRRAPKRTSEQAISGVSDKLSDLRIWNRYADYLEKRTTTGKLVTGRPSGTYSEVRKLAEQGQFPEDLPGIVKDRISKELELRSRGSTVARSDARKESAAATSAPGKISVQEMANEGLSPVKGGTQEEPAKNQKAVRVAMELLGEKASSVITKEQLQNAFLKAISRLNPIERSIEISKFEAALKQKGFTLDDLQQ